MATEICNLFLIRNKTMSRFTFRHPTDVYCACVCALEWSVACLWNWSLRATVCTQYDWHTDFLENWRYLNRTWKSMVSFVYWSVGTTIAWQTICFFFIFFIFNLMELYSYRYVFVWEESTETVAMVTVAARPAHTRLDCKHILLYGEKKMYSTAFFFTDCCCHYTLFIEKCCQTLAELKTIHYSWRSLGLLFIPFLFLFLLFFNFSRNTAALLRTI